MTWRPEDTRGYGGRVLRRHASGVLNGWSPRSLFAPTERPEDSLNSVDYFGMPVKSNDQGNRQDGESHRKSDLADGVDGRN